ncbi:MAG: hypothetical protein ACFFBD_20530, partial [Candidatus Hodarchaeota archaeon]
NFRRFWNYEINLFRKNSNFFEDRKKLSLKKKPLPLLIISCTKSKLKGVQLLPALIRYQGPLISLVRRAFLLDNSSPSFNVLILSAKFGPLSPHQPIPEYNQIMTPERLEELQPLLIGKILSLNPKNLFINLSKNYFSPIEFKDRLIPKIVAKGTYMERYNQTKEIIGKWKQK